MPNIYIAGPMTGIPNYNFDEFFDAAEALEDGGWVVYNPAQNDLNVHGSLQDVEKAFSERREESLRNSLSWDLGVICDCCDAIFMLKNWEKSPGARAEHATAVALGLQIIYDQE